jgi:membrane AbrB-like protein
MPFAQAIIGCLIARSINQEILATVLQQWPLLLLVASLTLIASVSLGWYIGWSGILPGTTAIWGLLPGAASTMVILAEDFGADARLVAFMQYLRVLLVTLVASLVARYWAHIPASSMQHVALFSPIQMQPLLMGIGVICVSLLALFVPQVSGGVLIVSMTLGGIVKLGGHSTLELPVYVYAIAFILIGWNVGLRFTKDVLIAASKAFTKTLLSLLLLICFCLGSAAVLVFSINCDPLAAYLATSPGGVDSAAIIAASSHVDVSFVMALQIMRFLMTLIVGPHLSTQVAKLIKTH